MLHLPDWSHIDLPEHERNIHKMFGVNSALYLPRWAVFSTRKSL
jgi:hypothetical protein